MFCSNDCSRCLTKVHFVKKTFSASGNPLQLVSHSGHRNKSRERLCSDVPKVSSGLTGICERHASRQSSDQELREDTTSLLHLEPISKMLTQRRQDSKGKIMSRKLSPLRLCVKFSSYQSVFGMASSVFLERRGPGGLLREF